MYSIYSGTCMGWIASGAVALIYIVSTTAAWSLAGGPETGLNAAQDANKMYKNTIINKLL